jgi:hypothetical protein
LEALRLAGILVVAVMACKRDYGVFQLKSILGKVQKLAATVIVCHLDAIRGVGFAASQRSESGHSVNLKFCSSHSGGARLPGVHYKSAEVSASAAEVRVDAPQALKRVAELSLQYARLKACSQAIKQVHFKSTHC